MVEWLEDEQAAVDFATGKMGFGDAAIVRLYKYLYPDAPEVEGHLEVVYQVVALHLYQVLVRHNPEFNLAHVVFHELRLGRVYPEHGFYTMLLNNLKSKVFKLQAKNLWSKTEKEL